MEKNPLEIKKKLAFLSGNTKLYNRITPHELVQMCGKLYRMEQEKINEETDKKMFEEIVRLRTKTRRKNQNVRT